MPNSISTTFDVNQFLPKTIVNPVLVAAGFVMIGFSVTVHFSANCFAYGIKKLFSVPDDKVILPYLLGLTATLFLISRIKVEMSIPMSEQAKLSEVKWKPVIWDSSGENSSPKKMENSPLAPFRSQIPEDLLEEAVREIFKR